MIGGVIGGIIGIGVLVVIVLGIKKFIVASGSVQVVAESQVV